MREIHSLQLDPLIMRALEEDWGHGDWTTDLCIERDIQVLAKIIARKPTLVSGVEVARAVFSRVDPELDLQVCVANGNMVDKGEILLIIKGRARSILKAERVALNFLARMCGIADTTKKYIHRIKDYRTQLLDTRITTPGLRLLERAAAANGGARNHRLCLTDGVLVRANHIRASGGITKALNRLHESLPSTIKIEVETTSLEEVHEALNAGADLIVLDNMSISEMTLAVRTVQGKVLLEASGHITLGNVETIAKTGVDFISTSAILHSDWADFSLIFDTDFFR